MKRHHSTGQEAQEGDWSGDRKAMGTCCLTCFCFDF